MATVEQTLRELTALGKPGTARVYVRHGVSDPVLGVTEVALQTARAIGPVEVDHGQTGCKTPDATEYIPRMRAHRARRTRVTGARTHARRTASSPKAARKK